MVHDVVDRLPEIHVAAVGVFVPPVCENGSRGACVFEFPIELRHHVVHPAVACPESNIGIEVAIVGEGVGVAAVGVFFLVAPHPKRTDAEAHPGLGGCDCVVEVADEEVHVFTAPIVERLPVAVFFERFRVGKFLPFDRVGVEIVVHVHGVDVVAVDYVAHHRADKCAVFGESGVEIELLAIAQESLGVLVVEVILGEHFLVVGCNAVGVEPCVEFHAASVALVHHEFQRVPLRLGGYTLCARKEAAPRLDFRLVESIGLRTHLEYHGVHSGSLQLVEQRDEVGLVFLGRLFGILSLPHGVNPGAAKFAFRIVGAHHGGGKDED